VSIAIPLGCSFFLPVGFLPVGTVNCVQTLKALGIAGRLVKGMSVGSDWHGVAAVLRDEFEQGDDAEASSMADKVIMASLANIPGTLPVFWAEIYTQTFCST
jgi:hypothetical protein